MVRSDSVHLVVCTSCEFLNLGALVCHKRLPFIISVTVMSTTNIEGKVNL